MSHLQDIFDTIDQEHDKIAHKKTPIQNAHHRHAEKFLQLPVEKQNEISKELPFLYREFLECIKNKNDDLLDSDIFWLVKYILNRQEELFKNNLESYRTHLHTTQVSDTQGVPYTVWKEKLDLVTKALSTIEESQIKNSEYKTSLDKIIDDIENLHHRIMSTVNLFIGKPFEDNSKTGLEILAQNKDGQFAQFIIDFVNFFRTIGVKDPKEIETIKKNTSWQFWKKPRNTLISNIKDQSEKIQDEPKIK